MVDPCIHSGLLDEPFRPDPVRPEWRAHAGMVESRERAIQATSEGAGGPVRMHEEYSHPIQVSRRDLIDISPKMA